MQSGEFSLFGRTFSAVIFDFDGVIVHTEPVKWQAYQRAFKELLEIDLSADLRDWVGKGEYEIVDTLLRKYGRSFSVEQLVCRKREIYLELIQCHPLAPVNGVLDFIKVLSAGGTPIAIATGSRIEDVSKIMADVGLSSYFDLIVGYDAKMRPKPSPDIYLKVSKELSLDINRCLVFEDTLVGVRGAKAAGAFCVGVLTSFDSSDLVEADLTIINFSDTLMTAGIEIRK